ncbi:unnamed protein product [Symbiodinium natans]|uniref:Uncharacterized protein n=1 Tax=Symbiodinium natans TaxID=878477 RepID=A0A812SCL3_9DINO|nr:unnamed protein product [Symbiodinium natans]
MGLNTDAHEILTRQVLAAVIDKQDMLRLWNEVGKLHSGLDGSPRARAGSESTASPLLRAEEEDETLSELMWNPLDLQLEDCPPETDEGAALVWDPIGLSEADDAWTDANIVQKAYSHPCDGMDLVLSKPPGLEDVSQGHEMTDYWSRSTTAGTADVAMDYDGGSADALAAEMAAILDLMQQGMPGLPEVRGSPHWPCPGDLLFNAMPPELTTHNFCPWCGSARACFHRFCPQCGVFYPDLHEAPGGTGADLSHLARWQY